MSDVNNRLMEAVGDIMRTRPGIDPSLALRFALEADRDLATAYHMAGATGPDPGHNHPPERGVVTGVPIAHAGRRHYSELTPAEKAKVWVHKLAAPEAGGGFFLVDAP